MDYLTSQGVIAMLLCIVLATASQPPTKKPLSSYTDADFERLYNQWEDNDDEKLAEDELPPERRAPPSAKVNLKTMNLENPEELLKVTKRGQPMMIFATVAGVRDQLDAEGVTQVWQDGLFNAHIESKRFMVAKDKVVFTISDGALAWQAKEFLVKQPRCVKVTLEGKDFSGAGAKKDEL